MSLSTFALSLLASTSPITNPPVAEETPVAAPAQDVPAAAQDEVKDDGAIVVTARRREEKLQEVPIAVTVVNGNDLSQSGNFNVNRLQQTQPTLQFYSSNPRNSAINIRGLGAPFGLTNDGIEQGVGFYVDGVYIGRVGASTVQFVQDGQGEEQPGPHGTLYGPHRIDCERCSVSWWVPLTIVRVCRGSWAERRGVG